MIATYYELMGWDPAGVPTPAIRLAHHLEWTLAPPAHGATESR